ncbi:uncharacterized protein LOC143041555 [Oratosquilla oratoria]|uniref:uncharacterized protein LOC143041555 n=1 Tax=Oratosquilla oratoria TaxID=337810 RepID=UPI003F76BB7F
MAERLKIFRYRRTLRWAIGVILIIYYLLPSVFLGGSSWKSSESSESQEESSEEVEPGSDFLKLDLVVYGLKLDSPEVDDILKEDAEDHLALLTPPSSSSKGEMITYATGRVPPTVGTSFRVLKYDPLTSSGSKPGIREVLGLLKAVPPGPPSRKSSASSGREFRGREQEETNPGRSGIVPEAMYTSPEELWFSHPGGFNGSMEHHSYTLGSGCRKMVELGGESCHGDKEGRKVVCMDPGYLADTLSSPRCLVYSFGVGFDVSFEITMSFFKVSCEIFIFDDDPKHQEFTEGHDFGAGTYIPTRLGTTDIQEFYLYTKSNVTQHFRYTRFSSILQQLGHQNRTISYLKLDIEGHEWKVLRQIVLEGGLDRVAQLSLEIHLTNLMDKDETSGGQLSEEQVSARIVEYHEVLELLTKSGLELVYVQDNVLFPCVMSVDGVRFNGCKDTHWVRRKRPPVSSV